MGWARHRNRWRFARQFSAAQMCKSQLSRARRWDRVRGGATGQDPRRTLKSSEQPGVGRSMAIAGPARDPLTEARSHTGEKLWWHVAQVRDDAPIKEHILLGRGQLLDLPRCPNLLCYGQRLLHVTDTRPGQRIQRPGCEFANGAMRGHVTRLVGSPQRGRTPEANTESRSGRSTRLFGFGALHPVAPNTQHPMP